jgi:hypothetical protein
MSADMIEDLAAIGIVANPHGAAEQRVPCPNCAKNRRDTALGVNIETGAFHCFRCQSAGRAGGNSGGPRRVIQIDDPAIVLRKHERLRRTWAEAVPLTHPKAFAARNYLESRALGAVLRKPPVVLRAHPGLTYWDDRHYRRKTPDIF